MHLIAKADCLEFMRNQADRSVDLVFGSPPYEQARLYLEDGEDTGIARDTEAWVAWMVEVVTEARRISSGLVAFVVEGQTRNFRYSCGPALLMADLHRAGFHLRKPPIFHRVGIPGSGGPDFLRNDYEFIVCVGPGGKLPWSDNTALGHPPKWAPGGAMSHRLSDGSRRNQWGSNHAVTSDGEGTSSGPPLPSHRMRTQKESVGQPYEAPVLANPGNLVESVYTASEVEKLLEEEGNVISMNVGGGQMGEGDAWAAKNEAPFPEKLAEFFVLSFCPPGGRVLDPFAGSGTTLAVAVRSGREAFGCDVRASQVALTSSRLAAETPRGLFQ